MSKLRIFYVMSLVILGVLLVFTVFRSMAAGVEYSQVLSEQLLEQEDQWVVELHLLNHESQDTTYTISVLVDGDLCTDTIPIQSGRVFKYIVHIYKDKLDKREVSLAIYKEGEATPFEQTTYYLK